MGDKYKRSCDALEEASWLYDSSAFYSQILNVKYIQWHKTEYQQTYPA